MMTRICAWCKAVLGSKDGAETVTHGICEPCAARMEAEAAQFLQQEGEQPMGLVIVPAYGRDYQTAAEVRADWEANKDFKVASGSSMGRYINRANAEEYGIEEGSYIRYKKLEELTFIGVWDEPEGLALIEEDDDAEDS